MWRCGGGAGPFGPQVRDCDWRFETFAYRAPETTADDVVGCGVEVREVPLVAGGLRGVQQRGDSSTTLHFGGALKCQRSAAGTRNPNAHIQSRGAGGTDFNSL